MCTGKINTYIIADKDKYLNYETTTSDNIIGNECVRCHEREKLESFRVPNKFNITDGGIAKVPFPDMMDLKANANIKLLVDDAGQLLAYVSANSLPVDSSYHHCSGISIQIKVKGKGKAYRFTNVIMHLF